MERRAAHLLIVTLWSLLKLFLKAHSCFWPQYGRGCELSARTLGSLSLYFRTYRGNLQIVPRETVGGQCRVSQTGKTHSIEEHFFFKETLWELVLNYKSITQGLTGKEA